jgi:eukaryotic-like serine/threonine-protein kinase
MGSTTLALAGRYRLEERIAAGGVGEVWRGRDMVLARAVAVKLLRADYVQHPETLARFRAEARHAAGVSHPGIAQVYDYGEDGQPFLVMELVPGPSLAGLLLARGPLDVGTAMDVAAQSAAALGAAHAAGLVHRDIKPGNLLVAPGGQVKITDFGIAHAAGSAPLTRTGMVVGTPAYLAPERVAGKPATPASDLYSLGVVCYECLTGAPPFTGTPVEVGLAHSHGQLPTLPPHVPAEVAALVIRLTAKDPQARPATAAEAARWAARLRDDALAPGATARGAGRDDGGDGGDGGGPEPATVTDPLPGTLTGAPSQVMTDAQGLRPAHPTLPRSGLRRGRALALAAGVVVIIAGLAGWLLAGGPGAAQPGRHQAGPVRVSTSPTAPRLTVVSQASLAGQPVIAVSRELRQLGLQVQVMWQFSGRQQPGTVIAVQPTGRLPAGSTVTLTGALAPPGHRHGQGGGDNQGKGNRSRQGD